MLRLNYIICFLLTSILASASPTVGKVLTRDKDVKIERIEKTSKSTNLAIQNSRSLNVKSFRQWKNERIQESMARLNTTRILLEGRQMELNSSLSRRVDPTHAQKAKTEATVSKDISLISLENQMRLDMMSLELAKDLTVTDYFVGYVNKMNGKKESMSEIASKMSTEEVAELMSAYAQSIFGATSTDIPKTATNQDSKDPK